MKVTQTDALQFTNNLMSGVNNVGDISYNEINNSENMVIDGSLYPIVKKNVSSIKEFLTTIRTRSNKVILVQYKNKDSFYLFRNAIIDTDGKIIFVASQLTHPRRDVKMYIANYTLYNTKRWIYFVIRNIIIPLVKDSFTEEQCECKILRECKSEWFNRIKPLKLNIRCIDNLNIING